MTTTDIVERLRMIEPGLRETLQRNLLTPEIQEAGALLFEAAAEITRLRAEVAEQTRQGEKAYDAVEALGKTILRFKGRLDAAESQAAEARNAALEEAAKVAIKIARNSRSGSNAFAAGEEHAGLAIAAAIRALVKP